jgi:hypothetical protein
MKKNHSISKIIKGLVVMILLLCSSNIVLAQACKQIEILYQEPDCYKKDRDPNPAGGDKPGCKQINVCERQLYTYSASAGAWTSYNWSILSGPSIPAINPSSTVPSVNITWPSAGVYVLQLTVSDGVTTLTTCLEVTTKLKPTANFTFPSGTFCAGSNSVVFTNTSSPLATSAYSWDFGDPTSGTNNYSNVQDPTHNFLTPGPHVVTLIAYTSVVVTIPPPTPGTNGPKGDTISIVTCCADTIRKTINITAGSIHIDCISTVCAGSTHTYTMTGCASPVWSTPVGATSYTTSGNQITIVWGNGAVQGQIIGSCPGGCTASVSVPIIPTTTVITGITNPCNTTTSSYTTPFLPGTFYTWTLTDLTNGNNLSSLINTYPDNNTANINWNATAPGHTFSLQVSLNNKEICCKSTGSITITPLQKFVIYATSPLCPNVLMTASIGPTAFTPPTFTWATVTPGVVGTDYIIGTAASGYNSAQHTFLTANTYTFTATESTGKYCNTTASTTVVVPSIPPVGTISGPTAICVGGSFTYTMTPAAPAGFYYKWTIAGAGNVFMPGSISPTVTGNSVNVQFATITGASLSVQLVMSAIPGCSKPAVGISSFTSVTSCTMPAVSPAVCVDNSDSYTAAGVPPGTIVTWSILPAGLGTITSAPGANPCIIKWHGAAGAGPWNATVIATTPCGTCSTTVSIKPKFTFGFTQTNNICTLPSGATITLTGLPAGTYTYTWPAPFVPGPGATATISAAGIYSVSANNGACSFSRIISIKDPWTLKQSQRCKPYCTGTSVNDDLGVTVITSIPGTPTYQWFTGLLPIPANAIGGATLSTYTAPTYGNYCVEVKLGGCTKILTFNVEKICCAPIATISPITVVRTGCNSFIFTATATNPSGFPTNWVIDEGGTFPATSGVPFSYTFPPGTNVGNHCVAFHVGPPTPNPTSCTGNYSVTYVKTPIKAWLDDVYTIGCNGCISVNNLSDVSPCTGSAVVNYTWNFGDGSPSVSTGTSPTPPAHCYTTANPPGGFIYSVTITFSDVCDGVPVSCSETDDIQVFFTPIGINAAPVPVCTGQSVNFTGNVSGTILSYNWNFGDTYQAFTQNTVHAYNTPSPPSYPVVFTVKDNLGNTCTANTTLNVKPGISSCAIKPGYICPGSTATIGLVTPLGAGYTYQWQVLSGVTMINAPAVSTTASYTTNVAGFYQLIVTAPNGCTCTSNTVEVKNVPKPTVKFTVAPSLTICGGGPITVTAQSFPGYNYAWSAYGSGTSFGGNSFMAFYNIPSALTATTTNIHLVVSNEYGCIDSCIMPVVSQPIPAKPMISASSMCEGVPITLTVTNYASNITWNNGVAASTITVSGAGTYVATYTNPVTGCTSSKSITINRRPSTGLFPTLCDSIPCDTCVRPFAIYAPGPLVGALANIYNVAWYSGTIGSATPITTGLNVYNGLPNGVYNNLPGGVPTGTYFIVITDTYTGCKDTSKYYNVVVPPCDTCNCKESSWGDIVLYDGEIKGDKIIKQKKPSQNGTNKRTTRPNGQDDGNPFPPKNAKALPVADGKKLECKGTYELPCNKPYTIGANWFCRDTSCPGKITYSLQPPTGTPTTGTAPATFTPTQTGTYSLTLYGWCNNKICDSCIINFVVKCDTIPKDCCKGSSWKEEPYYYFGASGTVKPKKIDCSNATAILITGDDCKKPLVIGAAIQCPTVDCGSKDSVFLYNAGGSLIQSGLAPLTITSLANGNYTVVINGYCGGQLCLSCKVPIKVDCKPCECNPQEPLNIQLTKNGKPQQTKCGADLGKLNCKDNIVLNGSYTCNPKDCPANLTYVLTGGGGGTGTLPLTLSSLTPGSYSILIQAYCNGKLCKECTLTFTVECDKPCCPYTINAQSSQATYAPNASSTIVTNSFTITGIPATANITEVRANVISYTIDDNYKGDCMKCVNLPFTWASASTATNIATAPPKITMFGGVTVPSFNGSGTGAYQNPKEIIWNNGSNLNPSGTPISTIGISFILPPTPAIDCCELKGKICVKFTFRDEKCNECEAIGCFDFVIKKK